MPFIKDGVAYIILQPIPRQPRWKALIDIEDMDRVSATKWYGQRSGRTIYVRATSSKMLADHHSSLQNFIMRTQLGERADHINGNGLDNRKANLRLATQQQNSWNSLKTDSPHVTSRFKGVMMTSSGRWAAYVTKGDDTHALGMFDAEADAARAYDAAALRLFGEFAKTNAIMGLFGSPTVVRDQSGRDGKLPDGAEFVRTTRELEPWEQLDAANPTREEFAKVVAFARHPRYKTILYVLDNGKTVRPADYQGPKLADSVLNQFAQTMKDSARLRKESKAARQMQGA
jgi:hypothetical protein